MPLVRTGLTSAGGGLEGVARLEKPVLDRRRDICHQRRRVAGSALRCPSNTARAVLAAERRDERDRRRGSREDEAETRAAIAACAKHEETEESERRRHGNERCLVGWL